MLKAFNNPQKFIARKADRLSWSDEAESRPLATVQAELAQLFLEVVAKNAAHRCSTFVPPHLGHLTLFLSCSVTVKTVENFLLQDVQRYSYCGMAPSLAPRFS